MIDTPEGLALPERSALHPQGHEWERAFTEDHGDIMTVRYRCQERACSAFVQSKSVEQVGLNRYE